MINKKILIYGGSSLISLELIQIYLRENYELIIFCRDQNSFLNKIKRLDLNTEKFTIYEADLTELEKNLKLVADIKSELKGIIWIAGETGNVDHEIENTNLAKKNIKINFLNPVLIINNLILKLKKDQNPFIAVVTSVAGLRGRQKNIFYGSAKSGMISYLSGLRQKFDGKINIITVIPGYMNTEKFNIKAPKFLITSPKNVANKIAKAIKNKQEVIYINFFWRIIMFLINLIPETIFKKLRF